MAAGRGGGLCGAAREVERLRHDGRHRHPRRGAVRAKALPKALKAVVGRNDLVRRGGGPCEACQVQVDLDAESAKDEVRRV